MANDEKDRVKKLGKVTEKQHQDGKIDALIFIDTNILLDFYRMPSEKVSIQILDKIIEHKDIIISSTQLEMEFKNNRFGVLKLILDEFNKIGSFSLMVPDMFVGDEYEGLKEARKEISKHQKNLSKKLTDALVNTKNDEVYNKLNILFKNVSEINLSRNSEWQEETYLLAQRRFNLGYPPRKSGDKTFGDGFNWEWILKCAENTGKKIIIVSRDGDYGKGLDKPILNTFLADEVLERIGENCDIILTDELAIAFEMVQLPLSEEMVEEEQKVINLHDNFITYSEHYARLQDYMKLITEPARAFITPDYMTNAIKISEIAKGYQTLTDLNPDLSEWRKNRIKLWSKNENEEKDGL